MQVTNTSTQTETKVEESQERVQHEEEQAPIKIPLGQYADDSGCDDSNRDSAMEESDFSDSG